VRLLRWVRDLVHDTFVREPEFKGATPDWSPSGEFAVIQPAVWDEEAQLTADLDQIMDDFCTAMEVAGAEALARLLEPVTQKRELVGVR
jgi:hypothetical protein